MSWWVICLPGWAGAQLLDTAIFSQPDTILKLEEPHHHLTVDNEGNLLLLSEVDRSLKKYFAFKGFDSVLVIGGKSVREGSLLGPAEILTANRQRVYVLDASSQSVLLYSKDLRLIQRFDLQLTSDQSETLEAENMYARNMAVGPGDELFVLNQQTASVWVYGLQPGVKLTFGGPTYGPGALYAPIAVDVGADNWVYVADTTDRTVMVYDTYGRIKRSISLFPAIPWTRARLYGQTYACWHPHGIGLLNLQTDSFRWFDLPDGQELIDFAADSRYFYLLFSDGIYFYRIKG